MEQPPEQATSSRSQLMVRELLEERRDLLVQLNDLAGTTPGQKKHAATPQQLQQFCQLLVDYAATGHFGLYESSASTTSTTAMTSASSGQNCTATSPRWVRRWRHASNSRTGLPDRCAPVARPASLPDHHRIDQELTRPRLSHVFPLLRRLYRTPPRIDGVARIPSG